MGPLTNFLLTSLLPVYEASFEYLTYIFRTALSLKLGEHPELAAALVTDTAQYRKGGITMKKRTNIDAVLAMVASYLEGGIGHVELEMDVPYELEKRYRRMVAEDRQFAELIYDYIIKDGINCGDHLSNAQLKDLIRRQYEEVLDIVAGGFC